MTTNNVVREEPLILVTNDDGIDAQGIRALATAMDEIGKVVVVAPLEDQSGQSNAVTVHHPVRARPWPFNAASGPLDAYAVTGTPTDCVKLAMSSLMERRPDLVVSGINHGENNAVNVVYSGTVGAVIEAAIVGVNGIAFSLCTKKDLVFETAALYAKMIVRKVLEEKTPGILFNVNVPALPTEEIRGVAVTRLANSRWVDSFVKRRDPMNRPYYWLSGEFVNFDNGERTDMEAVEQGMVSVTPLQYDMTNHSFLEQLHSWQFEGDPAR